MLTPHLLSLAFIALQPGMLPAQPCIEGVALQLLILRKADESAYVFTAHLSRSALPEHPRFLTTNYDILTEVKGTSIRCSASYDMVQCSSSGLVFVSAPHSEWPSLEAALHATDQLVFIPQNLTHINYGLLTPDAFLPFSLETARALNQIQQYLPAPPRDPRR
jgi:hypothetical protein